MDGCGSTYEENGINSGSAWQDLGSEPISDLIPLAEVPVEIALVGETGPGASDPGY